MLCRRTLLATLPALLAGCATPPPAPPELLLRLPPATLGRRLAWAQRLQVHAGDRTFEFEALLEADEQSLRLALLAFARPMARLHWDGSTLQQHTAPGWPTAVSVERVLSDMVLVLWPAAAVAAALPAGWSLQHDSTARELRWRGTAVQRVRYDGLHRMHLEHLFRGYRMQIDSQVLP